MVAVSREVKGSLKNDSYVYLIETVNQIEGKLRENKHRSISRLPGRRNGEEI